MAIARNATRETYPELRTALTALLEHFQATFPTKQRASRIRRIKAGHPLQSDATTLWSAAFRANLPIAEELFTACHDQLWFELTEDNELIPIGVDEKLQKPAGKPNLHRHAANTRWTHRR